LLGEGENHWHQILSTVFPVLSSLAPKASRSVLPTVRRY